MFRKLVLFAALAVSVPFASSADSVPGFGELVPLPGGWWSSDFGIISFADGGTDVTRAFSSSLGVDLATDGTSVFSREFGKIVPSGNPGWVQTEGFGWVLFAVGDLDYGPWLWTERVGWMQYAVTEMGTLFWIPQIQSWGQVQEDGSFYSFDYRSLTPTEDVAVYISEVFGPVSIGEQQGWIYSEEFGYLWAARDSNASWFYSSAREEWLGVTPDGSIWSTREQKFIPKPRSADGSPVDFDINEVVWLQTDVSDWAETSELSSVAINGGQVCFTYEGGTRWRSFLGGTAYFNATPIVIAKTNGRYYASAFQWFRAGFNYRCKPIDSMWKASPAPLRNWRPVSGEKVGFLVSTPSRIGVPTRQFERTNIVWIDWP